MPVTELAILPLAPGVGLSDKGIRGRLLRSKQVMETALGIPGRRFVYYQGVEDPTVLYLLGDWLSTDEHWKDFIPSPENQELLEILKHDLDIPRIEMYHIDLPAADVPTEANAIGIGWHTVRQDDKTSFDRRILDIKGWLKEGVSGEMKPAGGWRVEKASGQQGSEEFVLFCGLEDVDKHLGFAKTLTFEKCDRIRDLVQDVSVQHGTRIDL